MNDFIQDRMSKIGQETLLGEKGASVGEDGCRKVCPWQMYLTYAFGVIREYTVEMIRTHPGST